MYSLDEALERCDSSDYYDSKFLYEDYEMECAIVHFDAVSCRQKKIDSIANVLN